MKSSTMKSEWLIARHECVRSLRYVNFAFLLLLLTGCGGTDEMRWKEQVYLHDGKLILVERYSTRSVSGFPNSRRGNILTQELRYAPLGVVWQVDGAREQLDSFDIVNGIPYLVASPPESDETFCRDKSPGEFIANYYRWRNGAKEKISRSEVPLSVMRRNLSGIAHWGYDRAGDRTYLSWYDVMDATHQPGPPILLTDMFTKKHWLRCK